jgi:hypothetical protein
VSAAAAGSLRQWQRGSVASGVRRRGERGVGASRGSCAGRRGALARCPRSRPCYPRSPTRSHRGRVHAAGEEGRKRQRRSSTSHRGVRPEKDRGGVGRSSSSCGGASPGKKRRGSTILFFGSRHRCVHPSTKRMSAIFFCLRADPNGLNRTDSDT